MITHFKLSSRDLKIIETGRYDNLGLVSYSTPEDQVYSNNLNVLQFKHKRNQQFRKILQINLDLTI